MNGCELACHRSVIASNYFVFLMLLFSAMLLRIPPGMEFPRREFGTGGGAFIARQDIRLRATFV